MKTAVITGAAGGIGFAAVEKFVSEGYAVVAMDVVPAETAAEKFARFGDRVVYFRGDLSRAEDRTALVNLTYEKFFGEVKNELKELLRYDIKTEEELICYMKREEKTIKEAYRMNKELYSPEGIKKGNGSKRSASSVAYCLYLMFC